MHPNNLSELFRRLGAMTVALYLLDPVTAVAREKVVEQSTVAELLRLDSQAALLAARKNVFGIAQHAESGQNTGSQATTRNQVLAIYGVAKNLTAEVLLESEPHVFKHSRTRPVAGSLVDYRLERIAPPCVHLKKAGQSQVICLH